MLSLMTPVCVLSWDTQEGRWRWREEGRSWKRQLGPQGGVTVREEPCRTLTPPRTEGHPLSTPQSLSRHRRTLYRTSFIISRPRRRRSCTQEEERERASSEKNMHPNPPRLELTLASWLVSCEELFYRVIYTAVERWMSHVRHQRQVSRKKKEYRER